MRKLCSCNFSPHPELIVPLPDGLSWRQSEWWPENATCIVPHYIIFIIHFLLPYTGICEWWKGASKAEANLSAILVLRNVLRSTPKQLCQRLVDWENYIIGYLDPVAPALRRPTELSESPRILTDGAKAFDT